MDGGYGKLHNEDIRNLYISHNSITMQRKKDEIGGTCRAGKIRIVKTILTR